MTDHSARHHAQRKPTKCPECGASPVASILYGLPALDETLEAQIEGGLIVLGGCIVSGDDMQRRCTICGIAIYRDARRGNFV